MYRNIGKIVGGTKGNFVLEYISGSPNKEQVVEAPPNPLDYDELEKYGYGHLVTPIMKAGGRLKMYELLQMDPPPMVAKPKPKQAPKLVIDRLGTTDTARYSGLKLGQMLDDTVQGAALQKVQDKIKAGEEIGRPKLQEELYVMPFADTAKGAQWTPEWTVETLDAYTKQRGLAQSWARAARDGEFIQDPDEIALDTMTTAERLYSIVTTIFVTIAYGQSTPNMITNILPISSSSDDVQYVLQLLQIPAFALIVASVGSGILCSYRMAPMKNRNAVLWFVKGYIGGPLTIQYLQNLASLQTQKEQRDERRTE
jgi:hypothetical protein